MSRYLTVFLSDHEFEKLTKRANEIGIPRSCLLSEIVSRGISDISEEEEADETFSYNEERVVW